MEPTTCDLCGHDDGRTFPSDLTGEPGVRVCGRCGLMYSNPRLTPDEIRSYYRSEFDGDPGGGGYSPDERPDIEAARFEEAKEEARDHVGEIIPKFVDPNGKRWLELRFRSGGVLGLAEEMDADVHGTDPFPANVARAKRRFGEDRMHHVSVYDMLEPVEGPFDVVSMLSIHVLSHAPDPVRLLRGVRDRLPDDGIVLIDEKDVTRVPEGESRHPLGDPNPKGHFHHVTFDTACALVRQAGLEVDYAEFYPRVTALEHFLLVARPGDPDPIDLPVDDPDDIYAEMMDLRRQLAPEDQA